MLTLNKWDQITVQAWLKHLKLENVSVNLYNICKLKYALCTSQALSGPIYLVGGRLSCADVQLLECTLMLEEKFAGILAEFPNLKVNLKKKHTL